MILELKYFGQLTEIAGTGAEQLNIENTLSIGQLKIELVKRYPKLENRHYKVAVNQVICADEFNIDSDAEVAFLPPFAGG